MIDINPLIESLTDAKRKLGAAMIVKNEALATFTEAERDVRQWEDAIKVAIAKEIVDRSAVRVALLE